MGRSADVGRVGRDGLSLPSPSPHNPPINLPRHPPPPPHRHPSERGGPRREHQIPRPHRPKHGGGGRYAREYDGGPAGVGPSEEVLELLEEVGEGGEAKLEGGEEVGEEVGGGGEGGGEEG